MDKALLQQIVNELKHKSIVEISTPNIQAAHKACDKILRIYGLKKEIAIAKDVENSTLIFRRKSK